MMRSSKKMGPMSQMMDMLPGEMGKAARNVDPQEMDRSLKRTEAIICSMTPLERRNPEVLNASRRRRIARGCGLEVQDVNRLVKQFREMQRLMKTLQKTGSRGLGRLFG
jgi:signal recognition particle subunit SRP54